MIWKRWNKQVSKRNYRLRYLKKADTVARRGKLVYVRQEYHERIRRIARIIGGDDLIGRLLFAAAAIPVKPGRDEVHADGVK